MNELTKRQVRLLKTNNLKNQKINFRFSAVFCDLDIFWLLTAQYQSNLTIWAFDSKFQVIFSPEIMGCKKEKCNTNVTPKIIRSYFQCLNR